MKKQYAQERRLDGLLPIFQSWSRYSRLYRDTVGCIAIGRAQARARARHGLACVLGRATVQARHGAAKRTTRPSLRARESDSARARPGHSGVAIRFLYRERGQPFVLRHSAVIRPSTHATRRPSACDKVLYHDTIFVS